MKNKILIIIVSIFLLINTVFITNIFFLDNVSTNESILNSETSSYISIFVENENGGYNETTVENFTQRYGYILNEDDSYCINSSDTEITYNSDTQKISITGDSNGKCYLYFDYEAPTLAEFILTGDGDGYTTVEKAIEGIESKGTPNFNSTSTADAGLYATEDISGGTTYYFRGAVDDNYLTFAGLKWRIIRIDEDGNIKLVLASTIGSYNFNDSYNLPEYSGYEYATGELHGSGTDSEVKEAVDSWYATNIVAKDYDSYIADTKYCIERTNYTYASSNYTYYDSYSTSNTTYYKTLTRISSTLSNISPSLACTNNGDVFTYSAGIISADEVVLAGGKMSTSNKKFYLYDIAYNSSVNYYWVLTPYAYINESGSSVFFVNANGNLINKTVNVTGGVFPTISLKANITDFSGTGTSDDPYEIN